MTGAPDRRGQRHAHDLLISRLFEAVDRLGEGDGHRAFLQSLSPDESLVMASLATLPLARRRVAENLEGARLTAEARRMGDGR